MTDICDALNNMAIELYRQGEKMLNEGKQPSASMVGILCGLSAAKVLANGGTEQDAWSKIVDVQLAAGHLHDTRNATGVGDV